MFRRRYPFTPNQSRWSRMLSITLLVGLLTTFFAALLPAPVFAQPEEPAAETETATDEAAEGDTVAEAPQESLLAWMIRASGIFGLLILILSFVMVALITMNTLSIRRNLLMPPAFIEAFEQRLAQKDYQGAYELAKSDDSFLARVLAAGLSRLNRGYDEAIEGMQEVGEDENMTLEHRLSYLAMIASLGPMLGLSGTVYGMILSFRVIANSAEQPKPKDLADGIATALFTTIEGLAVAIPAMIAYGLFRNRVARYVLEIGIISEGLMNRFSTMGKKGAGGGAPAAAPAAPKQD